MEKNVITFVGNNEKLFTKILVKNVSSPKLTLIVPETHNAILVKDGQMLQTLSSGKYLMSSLIDLKTDADSKIEILFMSKTAKLKLLWGTAQMFMVYDSNLEENYKVGMSGDIDVQIGDPRKCYLYLIGADSDLTSENLQMRIMSTVVSVIEGEVVEYINANSVPFNKISVVRNAMTNSALTKISQKLMNEYGITVFTLNIANIIIDEQDYARLNALSKGQNAKKEKTCPACGAVMNENASFCNECGSEVLGDKICPECSTVNPPKSKFCSGCGHKFA